GQFSPQLVAELHANGLRACAWQYVYGAGAAGEANLGARAVANGADCLVIDAEAEYEGHYSAAQTYIAELRARIGPSYPLALASFPYVSYHPSLPYSVFLGPGGAQYNAPQMYWKAIGTSVDTVYANTYIANRIYGRPIFPLGQTYGAATPSDILRFRREVVIYGATGTSRWDWQETSPARPQIKKSFSDALDQRRGAQAAAAAHGHEADLVVGALELVQHRGDQPRARRAQRVPESHRAAVDVDAVHVGVVLAPPGRH